MAQLSFYSAVARLPTIADLAGLLCANGQAVRFGSGEAARLSIVVANDSRARAMALACAERGVDAALNTSAEGHPLLRTAFRADLAGLAARWLRDAVKTVPDTLDIDGAVLRIWAMAAGAPHGAGYQLGLDPHAPRTHDPLAAALARSGLGTTKSGGRSAGPVLRIVGRRRVARLAELVGDPPAAGRHAVALLNVALVRLSHRKATFSKARRITREPVCPLLGSCRDIAHIRALICWMHELIRAIRWGYPGEAPCAVVLAAARYTSPPSDDAQ